MTSRAYYNEIDPYAAQWLRNLIAAGHIAPGDVDTRSIVNVGPDDLKEYTQCHFFAGIGGWSLAARLVKWPDERLLWTGSCPCQPFSVAGKGAGEKDDRHLWPVFFDLIQTVRPPVVMGEQVAAAVGKNWLDGVQSDLEGIGYAFGAAVVPACAVDAPHRRDRLWFVADTARERGDRRQDPAGTHGRACFEASGEGSLADAGRGRRGEPGEGENQLARRAEAIGSGCGDVDDAFGKRLEGHAGDGDDRSGRSREAGSAAAAGGAISDADQFGAGAQWEQRGRQFGGLGRAESHWARSDWAIGADGKARRVEPGIRLLAHGVPARVGKLRAYGNAIVPQVAAEIIAAFMEARP